MKTQMLKSTLIAAAASLLAACGTQPAPPCAVAHGGYAARFTEVSCTGTGCTGGTCHRAGDLIGVQKYNQASGLPQIYLKSEWLAENYWLSTNPDGTLVHGDDPAIPTAHGTLTSFRPAADNFCTVPTLNAMSGPDVNGDPLTYQFSNVRFYNTGQVPGTQWTADLTISNDTGDCVTQNTVAAIYPVVVCNNPDTGVADSAQCSEVDAVWSGLQANPLFDLECKQIRNPGDPDLFGAGDGDPANDNVACVAKGNVPSLKTGS